MKKGIMATLGLLTLFLSLATVTVEAGGRRCISGAGGTAFYYYNTAEDKGIINLSDGSRWWITLYSIDDSGISNIGTKAYDFFVQDHGSGGSGVTIGIRVQKDFNGPGGHLLQLYTLEPPSYVWTVRRSHCFSSGGVSGAFDICVELKQWKKWGDWEIGAWYCLHGGDWKRFAGIRVKGMYFSSVFDLTQSRVGVRIDSGADGTLCFNEPPEVFNVTLQQVFAIPEMPLGTLSAVLLTLTALGLAYRKRSLASRPLRP